MKYRFVLLAGLILYLVMGGAVAVKAGGYFVDPEGNDAWSGSTGSPWRTLQHAVDFAGPGDTITVNSGSYAGFRAQKSGSDQAWITLQAAEGAQVVIDRPGAANKHDSNLEFETWEGDGTVSYWKVIGLQVKDAPRYGIDIRGTAATISHHFEIVDNQVWNSGSTGIFTAFVDDALLSGNRSYANGEHGIYVSNSGDRPTVSYNWLYDNQACGVQLNGDLSMGGDGVISDVLIQGNQIYGNGSLGGAGINLDGVVGSRILDNNLYDNLAGGLALFQIDGGRPSSDALIQGNTIRMPSGSRWAINLTETGTVNVSITRNTVYHAGSFQGSIRIPQADLSGFYSDFNELTGRFSINGGAGVIGWETWRALGYDANSQEAASEQPTPDQESQETDREAPAPETQPEEVSGSKGFKSFRDDGR